MLILLLMILLTDLFNFVSIRTSPTRGPIICIRVLLIEFRTCFKYPGPSEIVNRDLS
jgi:hypothetical protein